MVLDGGIDNPVTYADGDEKSRHAAWDRIAIGSANAIAVDNGLFRRSILLELPLIITDPIVVDIDLLVALVAALLQIGIFSAKKEFMFCYLP